MLEKIKELHHARGWYCDEGRIKTWAKYLSNLPEENVINTLKKYITNTEQCVLGTIIEKASGKEKAKITEKGAKSAYNDAVKYDGITADYKEWLSYWCDKYNYEVVK
jgi:hypothetical protein